MWGLGSMFRVSVVGWRVKIEGWRVEGGGVAGSRFRFQGLGV